MLGLRNPVTGTQFILDANVVFKRLACGGLVVTKPTTWQSRKRYRYQFEALTLQQKDTFLETYFFDNEGVVISVTDEESVTYSGVITTTSLQVQRKASDCTWILSFEIEEE